MIRLLAIAVLAFSFSLASFAQDVAPETTHHAHSAHHRARHASHHHGKRHHAKYHHHTA